jgi:hypothetical protein
MTLARMTQQHRAGARSQSWKNTTPEALCCSLRTSTVTRAWPFVVRHLAQRCAVCQCRRNATPEALCCSLRTSTVTRAWPFVVRHLAQRCAVLPAQPNAVPGYWLKVSFPAALAPVNTCLTSTSHVPTGSLTAKGRWIAAFPPCPESTPQYSRRSLPVESVTS